jgi:leader peptidase (prepilin peptidase)/N-methyltransferase
MHAFWTIFLFILGACLGSFLNVIIWRMPRGESIAFPGSHCPSCGRGIAWYDNIPLLSWLLLRGRCRHCETTISPRYLIVEAITGLLVAGLYVCYYILNLRGALAPFPESWPLYAAHVTLICGLLACSLIDAETFTVPLEVCWFVSLVGLGVAAASPQPALVPTVPAPLGAGSIGAVVGLGVALFLQYRGIILPSFIDAEAPEAENLETEPASARAREDKPVAVAYSSENGVNPRVEILREVLFLLPVLAGGFLAGMLVAYVPALSRGWSQLMTLADGRVGWHVGGFTGALFGYFIGGAWVWGMRIFGTLAFGKEAMGLGDVHLMAAVGAVCGWVIPSVAFFVAPFFGLLWALALLVRKGQHELPYGPWLSLASLTVMIFYDYFAMALEAYARLAGL